MSAESSIISCSWPVGHRTCTFSLPKPKPGAVMQACVEWAPDAPTRLSETELKQYRSGRHAALIEASKRLGIAIGVLDI